MSDQNDQTPGAQTPGAQTPGAQTPGAQTISPQKMRRREMRKLVHERTLAFFQASDDPLEDYFELLRDTMLRNAKDRQEKEALFESISYAIKERYFKQKTLTELAHMLNKPREYVRMMTDKRLSFMIRTHLIDFQMILQLIEEAKGTEEEAGDEAGDEA